MTPARLFPLSSMAVCLLFAIPVAAQEVAENPVYKNWEKFPVGSSVTYRSITKTPDFEAIQEYTLVLKDKTPDRVVIEKQLTSIDPQGNRTTYPAMTSENPKVYKLPKGVKVEKNKKQPGLKGEGEEELEILGRKIKAQWFKATSKVEAGDTHTSSWSSAEIPGGLIKAENDTPATKSLNTVELISMTIPEAGTKD